MSWLVPSPASFNTREGRTCEGPALSLVPVYGLTGLRVHESFPVVVMHGDAKPVKVSDAVRAVVRAGRPAHRRSCRSLARTCRSRSSPVVQSSISATPDPSRPRARLDKVAAVRRPAGRRTVSTLLRLSLALAASR
jgi:hypothetical protein